MKTNGDHDLYTPASVCYNSTKEIQKFLIKNLQLTPRRKLFEEYAKKLASDRKKQEEVNTQQCCESSTQSSSMRNYEVNIIADLSEFRRSHPKECMSDLNHRRFRREKQREEEFLQHSDIRRLVLNEGLIQSLIKSQKDSNKSRSEDDNKRVRTRSVHFAPDNSLALSYQKYKT